ncbi:MAG: YHS domain-containing protein [Phenylobacterium sp.]|jgi:YHS domain-containing protein
MKFTLKSANHLFNKILMLTLLLLASNSYAGKFFAPGGIAIGGYDPVSYFVDNQAQKGSEQFKYAWHNVDWHFSSAQHLTLFKAAPQKYAPQFGGFCALGAAHNGAVPVDPTIFTIHKGKLYLNMATPVGVTWRLNPDFHIARASKAWDNGDIVFY